MDVERHATASPSVLRRRPSSAVLLGALVVLAASELVRLNPLENAVDFYLYWAVPKARTFSSKELGSPYTERSAYASVLSNRAFGQELGGFFAHRWNMRAWDPTGTPLFYASFSPLPSEYLTAARLYRSIQVAALGFGVLALGALSRLERSTTALAFCLVVVAFTPVRIDFALGNFNAIQLVLIAGIVWLAARVLPESRGSLRRLVFGSFMTALGWMVLMKPNLSWVAVALGAHLGLRYGWRSVGSAALTAALPLGLLVGFSCLSFGSGSVWRDWAQYLLVANPEKLASYSPRLGNVSLPRFLGEILGVSAGATTLGSALAFGFGLIAVSGRRAVGVGQLLRRSLSDPECAGALGVLLGLLLAPLVWWHYYVLLLVPAVWVARDFRRSPVAVVLTGAALLLNVKLPLAPDSLLASAGLGLEARVRCYMLSFVLLVVAFFVRLAADSRNGEDAGSREAPR